MLDGTKRDAATQLVIDESMAAALANGDACACKPRWLVLADGRWELDSTPLLRHCDGIAALCDPTATGALVHPPGHWRALRACSRGMCEQHGRRQAEGARGGDPAHLAAPVSTRAHWAGHWETPTGFGGSRLATRTHFATLPDSSYDPDERANVVISRQPAKSLEKPRGEITACRTHRVPSERCIFASRQALVADASIISPTEPSSLGLGSWMGRLQAPHAAPAAANVLERAHRSDHNPAMLQRSATSNRWGIAQQVAQAEGAVQHLLQSLPRLGISKAMQGDNLARNTNSTKSHNKSRAVSPRRHHEHCKPPNGRNN